MRLEAKKYLYDIQQASGRVAEFTAGKNKTTAPPFTIRMVGHPQRRGHPPVMSVHDTARKTRQVAS